MKKVKIYATCFWEDDQSLFEDLKQYGFGSAAWKNIEFTLCNNFDKTVILTYPNENHIAYNPNNAITFLTEPPKSRHHIPHKTSRTSSMYLPLPFWINSRKANKERIRKGGGKKNKILSAVTSELSALEGHKRRLEFLYYFDKVVKEGFDLYGKKGTGEFFNLIGAYRGEIADKFDALIGYEYHFACENSFEQNYFTEKIIDPIMAGTLCFYDGCLNINEFIDEKAFIKIDVKNVEGSIDKIIHSINNQAWNKRIEYIIKQKKRLLSDFNPLNIIWLEINEKDILRYLKI